MAEIIIDSYVTETAYNEIYIFAKQVSVPDDIKEKIDTSNPSFFILIVESGELFGPYTEKEFNEKCEELEMNDIPEWIVTTDLKNTVD